VFDRRRFLGQEGERIAEALLVREGAVVLARNYRTSLGELDLVVEQEGDLVGVEVKSRQVGQPALPEEAVGASKLARLGRLLAQYAQEVGREQWSWRIDVVALEVTSDGTVKRLEHIRDVYEG
jgi:putative endonuclease